MAGAAAQEMGAGCDTELGAFDERCLEGRFVEIHSLDREVEAQDCLLGFLGESVNPNGRRGVAYWDEDRGEYAVATLEGFIVTVPAENLRGCEHVGAEAGGFDLSWPSAAAARACPSLAWRAAEALQRQGYCLLRMPDAADDERSAALEAASSREGFELPPEELEDAYLGTSHSSKVAWLDSEEGLAGLLGRPRSVHPGCFGQRVADFSCALLPAASELLGFKPWAYRCGTLLRTPLTSTAERQELSPGPIAQADARGGLVEKHLDFLQRRKLCLMYLIESEGGSIQLFSRGPSSEKVVTLPAAKDRLLVFRHDLFGYSYKPDSQCDLVLQTWLLEEPQLLRLDGFEGGQRGLEAIYGGPSQAPDVQVHVMSAACRFPGAAHGPDKYAPALIAQTDGFLYPPLSRWDMSLYYSEDSEQFGSSGKSGTKHCALLGEEELICFDNLFFGIPAVEAQEIAPAQRVLLETSYEAWAAIGHTTKSLRGAQIYVGIGDQGLDEDPFRGFSDNKEAWLKCCGPNHITSGTRLCHMFGLVGPVVTVDTACSSSIVAANICHSGLRQREKGVAEALSMGLMQITNPFVFIGLSAAGMLGRGGRCKTFDDSANGYNRGEGTGGLTLKVSDDLEATHDRIACYVSSYINQDGRSASLTAPNGPSQQQCIKGSLRQAGLTPGDVANNENHGTGTALGDPIESGSVRAVFRREAAALLMTSGKSHIGHLESTAGSVGLLKMICTLTHAAGPSNVHLRRLNANIDQAGFPALIPVEVCDLPTEHHYGGANSYGFGGTNARADIWARRLHRQRYTPGETLGRRLRMDMLGSSNGMPRGFTRLDMIAVSCPRCLGPMCWLCGAAAPDAGGRGRHRCASMRAEDASYKYCSDCYEGAYLCQGPAESLQPESPAFGHRLFLLGTWDAWREPVEMQRVAGGLDADIWEGEICLSDTRQELFHLSVLQADDSKAFLHPVAKRAGQRVRVAGPSADAKGRHWLVDGFRDGVPVGTVYRIRFEWSAERKRVTWTPSGITRSPSYQHTYCLASSLTGWVPLGGWNVNLNPYEEDKPCFGDADDPALWWWNRGRIPASGKVELTFVRDHDQSQMIYPLQEYPSETSVPVMGPDEGGSGKRWLAWGYEGEQLNVSIQVVDGEILVRIATKSMGDKVWRSQPGGGGQAYHAAGTFNDWAFTAMEADPEAADVYACRIVIGERCFEEFKIVVNQNWNMAMYPANNGDAPGVGLLCGPDRKGAKRSWRVEGLPGQELELRLDFGAEDHCDMVTCRPC